MLGGTEHRTAVYTSVHKDSVEQGTCVTSVYKAMGSPKDHIAYCSIPGATDRLPTCGENPGFSNIATEHTEVCHVAQKIQTSAKSIEISVNPIEPLRYFEPYIRFFSRFASLSQKWLDFRVSKRNLYEAGAHRNADNQTILAKIIER
ncbi:hypothetical protein [Legionella cherrii]|uniref:Uncharacterized protein n=1 Tax=Legionella cherrii TaxID=28084 RepID=A0A0W0SHA2_9GAMM|nr:hypothetical protein [Legionella cherrii]KTC82553.1 hypothetical protein Lche_0233 [Legionella cherrii]VEB35391.1 Uncharacterised protein [Legionella cherrii]